MLYSPALVTEKGNIALRRDKENFEAGFCLISETLPDLAGDLSFLHPDEKTYYDSLRISKRQLSYLLGRKAAKEAIAALMPGMDLQSIAIGFGVFQFPVVKYLVGQSVQVSISHCDEVAVAVAFPEEHPVGIDIESIDPAKCEVMKSYISSREFELMAECDLPFSTACTIAWTVKEALSKVFRTGLTIDLSIIAMKAMEKTGNVYTSTFYNFSQYKAISLHAGQYVCSIVLPRKTTPVLDSFFHSVTQIAR